MTWQSTITVSTTLLVLSAMALRPPPVDSQSAPPQTSQHILPSSQPPKHTRMSYQNSGSVEVRRVCEAVSTWPCTCDSSKDPPDLTCTLQGQPPSPLNSSAASRLAVGTLDLSYSDVHNTDWNWLSAVGRVDTLRLRHCNLTALPLALLDKLPHRLRVLDLAHNHLHNFATDSVNHLPLRQLDLSYNNLTALRINSSRSQLRQVKVTHNRVKVISLSGDCPANFTLLDASHNDLDLLPVALWECLRQVRLTHNSLSDLPGLSRSSRLRAMDVSHNRLSELPQAFLSRTQLLETLIVSGNQIALSPALSQGVTLSKLKTLDLSHNSIHSLPPALFTAAPALNSLDLSHNQVSQLSVTAFPALAAPLHSLRLSHNALHYIHAEAFHHLHSLRQLHLSQNPRLGHSGLGHVRFPEHVTILDLSGCGLREVDYCQLSHLHDLMHLNLSHNHLPCSCHLTLLYVTYGKTNDTPSVPWQCVSNQTGAMVSVAGQPTCPQPHCLSTDHHQRAAREVEVTVRVVLVEHNLITSWQLADLTPLVHGFRVLCLHPGDQAEDEAAHTSPILDRALRSYALTDLEDGDYTVCLDVLQSNTSVLKRVCQTVRGDGPNVLVGILAGTVFLFPCFIFVVYIIFKDRAIRRKLEEDGVQPHTLLVTAPGGSLQPIVIEGEERPCDFPFKDTDTATPDCSGHGQTADCGQSSGCGQTYADLLDKTDPGPGPDSALSRPLDHKQQTTTTDPGPASPNCPVAVLTQTDLCMQDLDTLLNPPSHTDPSVTRTSGEQAACVPISSVSQVPSSPAGPVLYQHPQPLPPAAPETHTAFLQTSNTPTDYSSSLVTASDAPYSATSLSPLYTSAFTESTSVPSPNSTYHSSLAATAPPPPLHTPSPPLPSSDVYIDSSTPEDATDSTALLSPTSSDIIAVTDTTTSSDTAQSPRVGERSRDYTAAMDNLDILLAELRAISE